MEHIPKPIRLPVIFPQPLVAGMRDSENKFSEGGRQFLLTVGNLLNASVKLFGDDEHVSGSAGIAGCDFSPGQDDWQFFEYFGLQDKPEATPDDPKEWLDFNGADYDLNGTAEARIADVLPFERLTALEGAAVDYGAIWQQINEALDSEHSFLNVQQTVVNSEVDALSVVEPSETMTLLDGQIVHTNVAVKVDETAGKTYVKTTTTTVSLNVNKDDPRACFAFLVAMVETRRRWVFGLLEGLHINAANPDVGPDLNDYHWNFIEKRDEYGTVNMAFMANYLGWFDKLNQRYADAAALITGEILESAKTYYQSVRGTADLADLRIYLDALESDDDDQIGLAADGLVRVFQHVFNQLSSGGLVDGRLKGLENRLPQLTEKIEAWRTELGREEVDSDAVAEKLSAVISLAEELYRDLPEIASLDQVQSLFDELSAPLSTTKLFDPNPRDDVNYDFDYLGELSKIIDKGPMRKNFGIITAGQFFRTVNNSRQSDYTEKKDAAWLEEYQQAKAGAEARAERRSENKRNDKASEERHRSERAQAKRGSRRPAKAKRR